MIFSCGLTHLNTKERQTERHPIEITSEKYRQMFEMKNFIKDAEGKEKKVLKRRNEEAKHKRRMKSQNVELDGNSFLQTRKLNAIHRAILAVEERNMEPSCVVMATNICVTNQAYQDITRIIFQIQKLVTLLPETPAAKKTMQAAAQTVDCDSNTSDLATQQ
jgi:hypothetical protein